MRESKFSKLHFEIYFLLFKENRLFKTVLFHPKIYDKRKDFYFDIINFPFLNGDIPHDPSFLTFLNLFGLQECLVIWLTSMLVANFDCHTSPRGVSVS